MDADEAYRSLAQALRRAEERAAQSERELTELRSQFEQLLAVLVGKGVLTDGHRALFARVADRAARQLKPRVRLRQYVDKYQMGPGPDIDCGSLLHLCHARCCSFIVDLTTQDLDEGRISWEVSAPYQIRREADGYCTHLDRAGGGCTAYAQRPATCRGFDCRYDQRIWTDWERRIPAPLPDEIKAPIGAAAPCR
jgi:hypothetical protein